MTESIELVQIPRRSGAVAAAGRFGLAEAERAMAFHAGFPEYAATPLARLNGLAWDLGLGGLYVKDESFRFGLNAFKVLGGSYAIGSYIAGRLGVELPELPYEQLVGDRVRSALGTLTFVTATDGNHGRGVAWTANRLGHRAVVYMPEGSAAERLSNIRSLGAEASITDLNYDDAVRLANRKAQECGWVMVQDTAWEGYEEIPARIMQGYTTMALEAWRQLGEKPTHIFLQAGVGAMAGAVAGFFTSLYGEDRPVITIVEPKGADCIFRTARANDGRLHPVAGRLDTMMAGLACGEPCTIAWDVLRETADNFVSCPDAVAALGMRTLGRPFSGDPRVISGESGAVTVGLVTAVMRDPSLTWLRERLRLDENARVLCFSTEGDTDRENYRRIVEE